jgi:signal transduction histidine kinase
VKSLGIPSLRWRLVAVMCLAYILVAAATEIAGYDAQRTNLHGQLESRARSDAAILAAGSAANLSSGGKAALQIFVTAILRASGVTYAAVTVEGNRIVASTRHNDIGKVMRLPFASHPVTRTRHNGDVEGVAPVVETTALGFATVVVSGASVQHDLDRLVLIETSVRVLGLLIFFLLSLVTSQYILGPLAILARAAGAIRRGHLGARIALHDGTELETVAAAFNDMAGALQQRIEHLSFLSSAGPILPAAFRDHDDVRPILADFCRRLEACGAGLIGLDVVGAPPVWWSSPEGESSWREALAVLTGEVSNAEVITVPVLGDAVFAAVRSGSVPFSPEEQQVITNFAYQVGTAADNARLFEEQQEALRVKDQFLSIVSHELRTPLTTIKGYAQMLRKRLDNDPDAERFADNIDAQSSRLSRLVDDLLDVTRFTRGEFDLMPKRMDIRQLLEETVARFRVVSPAHPIDLRMESGPSEGEWDRDRLEQVLNNLIGNAIKYSPNGGTVTVTLRHRGDQLEVAIRDQGVGIPVEDHQHLFERFYRGRAEGQEIKGLGLGLFVSKRIIEAHRGEIKVQSIPGQGSTFTFSLPLAPVPQALT